MNTLTAMLAVTPMMLAIGPGGALQAPLAITVFGGLFTATALTLIVIPVAYELIDELGEKLRTGFRKQPREHARVTEDDLAEPVAAGD
jgi:HAE1 family hydrophobic/amphiphilic exporter-1